MRRRTRRGSAPLTIRWATRWARVLVLPEPAPAITRRGLRSSSATPMSCSTAWRCSPLSSLRYVAVSGTSNQLPGSAFSMVRVLFLSSQWQAVCHSLAATPTNLSTVSGRGSPRLRWEIHSTNRLALRRCLPLTRRQDSKIRSTGRWRAARGSSSAGSAPPPTAPFSSPLS